MRSWELRPWTDRNTEDGERPPLEDDTKERANEERDGKHYSVCGSDL
jgi:hypothetical protein